MKTPDTVSKESKIILPSLIIKCYHHEDSYTLTWQALIMETASILFDTHSNIQTLIQSGMPESQAEAVVSQQTQLIEHHFATKNDLTTISANIDSLRQETNANIALLRQETNSNIEVLRQETKAEFEKVYSKIAETNSNIEVLRQETKAEFEKVYSKIAETNSNIEVLRQETKAEFEKVYSKIAETNSNIALLRQEANSNIDMLRQEVVAITNQAKSETIKWVLGFNLGTTVLVLSVVTFLIESNV